jgi:hypothetical protein
MINFTDITGLASSALAMTAMVTLLPGVRRLQRTQFALLVCAVAILVLIPFGGLPLAAYVRGWMGDLSITSLVLLKLMILRPLFGWTFNAPSPAGVTSDLVGVVGQPSRLASSSIRGLGWGSARSKYILLSIIALAALGLYPMALGIGSFDPYRLGYGNPWFLGGLLLLALAACFLRLPVVALAIALAVFAWGVGWYESTNLWDYLLDPVLAIYALSALGMRGIQALLKLRRG